jgi:serine/threonine-protein kinase RsbW
MDRREVVEDLTSVDPLVAWADALAEARGLDDHVRYAIQVCLEEGLANLIIHGKALPGAKAIIVTFDAAPPGATVTISDACAPFDVTKAAEPDADMADMPLGGLGLPLLRSFAATITYGQNGGRNVLTLTFVPAA